MTGPVSMVGERASWDRVLAALEDRRLVTRRRGDGHMDARCPAHADGRASLAADYEPGEPGKTLVCCHAGCEFDAPDLRMLRPVESRDIAIGAAISVLRDTLNAGLDIPELEQQIRRVVHILGARP